MFRVRRIQASPSGELFSFFFLSLNFLARTRVLTEIVRPGGQSVQSVAVRSFFPIFPRLADRTFRRIRTRRIRRCRCRSRYGAPCRFFREIVVAVLLLPELGDGRAQHQLASDLVQVELALVVAVDQFVTNLVVRWFGVGVSRLPDCKSQRRRLKSKN